MVGYFDGWIRRWIDGCTGRLININNFLDFIHRPILRKQNTAFWELDLLPS
jgi:hypothetical protein